MRDDDTKAMIENTFSSLSSKEEIKTKCLVMVLIASHIWSWKATIGLFAKILKMAGEVTILEGKSQIFERYIFPLILFQICLKQMVVMMKEGIVWKQN